MRFDELLERMYFGSECKDECIIKAWNLSPDLYECYKNEYCVCNMTKCKSVIKTELLEALEDMENETY